MRCGCSRSGDVSDNSSSVGAGAGVEGGGGHSLWTWKTAVTAAAAAATTVRVQCPATVVRGIRNHNTPGVPVPLRETRGCWTTLLRGGGSAPDESSESGATRKRPWGLHRSLSRRGGAWFTGYSDTTEEEESTELSDTDFSEEWNDGVIAEEGEGERDASRRGALEGAGSDEKGLYGVEGIPMNGFNSPVMAGSFEKKSEAKVLDEGKDKSESDDGEDASSGEEEDEDTSVGAVLGRSSDIYARTIARRRALYATLKVLQKALLRTAVLLVAFQMLPWLKHNVIAQWLLLGSIFLQAASEVAAIISFFAGGAEGGVSSPQDSEEASSAGGESRKRHSPPSASLVGGLMRAISPDHEKKQHLDFERLNDYFDKDSEALVVAGRTKADVAALFAAGAAEDTRLFGASVLRAVKGLTGSYSSNKSQSPGRTSGKGHKKKKRTKKPRSTATSSSAGISTGSSSSTDSSCSTGTLLEKKESTDASEETKPSARAAEVDGESVGSRPEPDGTGQEMTEPSNGSKTGDGSAGGAVETPCGNATARADGGAGVSDKTKRVFVVRFGSKSGGSGTSANPEMELLSGAVSFLIAKGNATTDEMVVCLESGGGEVSEFGLGAAKLARLREKGFRLTVCVDKIAASGGYMMACVADWLIAAPFAMLGSIGVVGGIPNFNKALRKAGIEYFHFTSGQQKSLVGPFQEVTRANQAMQQSQLDSVHSAFKRHVRRYRPSVDVENVGTGEVWLGLDAAKHCLIDEVGTTMQYLEARMADSQVFLVKPHTPKGVRGSSLLRLLLLGPLAAVGRFASSLSTAAAFLQEYQRWDRRGRSLGLGDLLSPPPLPSCDGHGMMPPSDRPDVANDPGRSCDPSLTSFASSVGLGGNSLLSGAKGWGAGPSLNPAVVEEWQPSTEGDSGPSVFSL